MATRFLIIDKNLGIFLGTIDQKAIFSEKDVFGFQHCYTFATEQEALEYIKTWFSKDLELSVHQVEVSHGGTYASLIDLNKSGFQKYLSVMLTFAQSPSQYKN